MSIHSPRRVPACGFTYLGVIFLVFILSIASLAATLVWSIEIRRANEEELLFIGNQFREAIEQYRKQSGTIPQPYPTSLEQLVLDKRFPKPKRYLRKIYIDPLTGKSQWGLVRTKGQGIVGIYSLSMHRPIRIANFIYGAVLDKDAKTYRDWRFLVADIGTGIEAEKSAENSPVNSAPAPAEMPVVPPQTTQAPPSPSARNLFEGLKNKNPETCERIRQSDLGVCADQEVKFGREAASDCLSSASVRYTQCLTGDGGALPGLYFRRN